MPDNIFLSEDTERLFREIAKNTEESANGAETHEGADSDDASAPAQENVQPVGESPAENGVADKAETDQAPENPSHKEQTPPEEKAQAPVSAPKEENTAPKQTAKSQPKKKTAKSSEKAKEPPAKTKNAGKKSGKQAEPKKKKGHGGLVIVVLIACLAGLAALYASRMRFFKTHFFAGTSIAGIDVSHMTAEEAKAAIQDKISEYSLSVIGRENTETITSPQIGLTYVDDGKVNDLLSGQELIFWLFDDHLTRDYEAKIENTISEEKARNAVNELLCFTGQSVRDPADAYKEKNDEGLYEIIPEDQGTRLKPEAKEEIMDAIRNRTTSIVLDDHDLYTKPTILSTDKDLNETVNFLNEYLAIRISYRFGDNVEEITGADIEPYITRDGTTVSLDPEWISDVVNRWADKYESFGKERAFTTHSGEVITAPGGDYGWAMDRETTKDELASHIGNRESGEYEPVWKYKAMGWENGGLGNTFVEVSIAEQKLFLHKDGEIILETDVVTGKNVPDRATIPGCYAIDAKKSPAVLGSLDVQGYAEPVAFWAPFNGGQGLHDAAWRYEFGGNIYQENGSHGCVNIPKEVMQQIYDTIEIGTAVVVY